MADPVLQAHVALVTGGVRAPRSSRLGGDLECAKVVARPGGHRKGGNKEWTGEADRGVRAAHPERSGSAGQQVRIGDRHRRAEYYRFLREPGRGLAIARHGGAAQPPAEPG